MGLHRMKNLFIVLCMIAFTVVNAQTETNLAQVELQKIEKEVKLKTATKLASLLDKGFKGTNSVDPTIREIHYSSSVIITDNVLKKHEKDDWIRDDGYFFLFDDKGECVMNGPIVSYWTITSDGNIDVTFNGGPWVRGYSFVNTNSVGGSLKDAKMKIKKFKKEKKQDEEKQSASD